MDEGLKRRLVGATILVSLAVIFVPMLLERDPAFEDGITHSNIPPRPQSDSSSRILPLEENRAVEPVERITPTARTAVDDPAQAVSGGLPSGQATTPGSHSDAVAPVESRVGLSAWVVQVGSFSKRENADSLITELRELDFPAFIEQAEVNREQVFRVRVGPEVDKKRAEEMMTKLNQVLKPKKLAGTLKRYP